MKISTDIIHQAIAHRRHLHTYPELSGKEYETAKYIRNTLDAINVCYEADIGGLGIVAWLGPESSDCLALRSDMDALPIQETNKTDYCSQNHAVMHACGHDVHMACLLGSIHHLKQHEDHLKKRVFFIFQPHEEVLPGGAQLMIKDGLFHRFPISKLIALHVSPELNPGVIGYHKGPFMAASDEIRITFSSRGGHAARPHLTGDTIAMGSNFIVQAQQLVSRLSNPIEPILFTVGVFEGIGATNIIPAEVKLAGTLRTMNEEHREIMHKKLNDLAENIATFGQGTCLVDINQGYPVLINDAVLTDAAIHALDSTSLTNENLPARMTSEDFAWYGTEGRSITLLRLGTGNPNQSGLHRPDFDIDEGAIACGIETLSTLALRLH